MSDKEYKSNPELKLRKALDIGDEISVGLFVDNILNGLFIDYDGYCRFVIDKLDGKYEVLNARYSIDDDTVYLETDADTIETDLLSFCLAYDIKKVIWYNR